MCVMPGGAWAREEDCEMRNRNGRVGVGGVCVGGVQAEVIVEEATVGGDGGGRGTVGAAAAAEGGEDLERSPHRLHTSCL